MPDLCTESKWLKTELQPFVRANDMIQHGLRAGIEVSSALSSCFPRTPELLIDISAAKQLALLERCNGDECFSPVFTSELQMISRPDALKLNAGPFLFGPLRQNLAVLSFQFERESSFAA